MRGLGKSGLGLLSGEKTLLLLGNFNRRRDA
jgi:hypothetical protein